MAKNLAAKLCALLPNDNAKGVVMNVFYFIILY